MKDYVNHNHIGIRAIDSWRIDEIWTNSARVPVPPPLPVIGKEPPKVFDYVRPGDVRNLMPADGIGLVRGNCGRRTNSVKLRDPLRIELDDPVILSG
jgi:hypothetical protein